MEIKVQQNISLRHLCTYRVGGPARFFAEARTMTEMIGLKAFAKDQKVPYLLLGGGSNVLFSDEGFPGLVIHNKMEGIQINGDTVNAEGGVNLTKLILICAQNNLGGISGLANVPGTVGGAVYGNAGIPDIWIGTVLQHAVLLPEKSLKPKLVGPDYFEFGYRTSKIKGTKDIVLSATLKLKPEPQAKIRADVNEYIKQRALKQPSGNSCGSFFKNPKEFPSAGWLIEQAGCKDLKVGGAEVSMRHANFLMNTGNATSKDIVELAVQVYEKVKEKFNVELEPEVQIYPISPFAK
jgi:UDP-N-acetylmuramate dehydrogenase